MSLYVMHHSKHYFTLVAMLENCADEAWAEVVRVWATAPRVYSGPSGPDAFIHPAFDLAQLAPAYIADIEPRLNKGLQDQNPKVAAYCALTLLLMNEHCLPQRYVDMLAERTELLDVTFGCFGTTKTLGEFAASFPLK